MVESIHKIHAQVHRFHDRVALYIGTGAPVYLKPANAREIAAALNSVAESCDSEAFTRSTVGTSVFTFEGRD